MTDRIVFFDTEVSSDGKVHDIGAVRADGAVCHCSSHDEFLAFCAGAEFLCGHNIIHHDLRYMESIPPDIIPIDTLYLSPLLFPKRPYHALVKDDKLCTDELNNPVNDSRKAQDLFYDEVNAFSALPADEKAVYYALLHNLREFYGFFEYVKISSISSDAPHLIRRHFHDSICVNADIEMLCANYPRETAYALALISSNDAKSVTPPWILHNFPQTENVIKLLRDTPCRQGCAYCSKAHDVRAELFRIFGFSSFRTYNGEPLQEMAARAAVDGKSLLALFPTGGGKSLTFQLPALMAGEAIHGLTVVISPLQSLMKDQVDNLAEAGITEAVTINGLQDPIERANSIERVANGTASLLYISPEQLRSRTIEKLIGSRTVARFVIDEAHCFSAWGQDFRVDYLYIGDFIKKLQDTKGAKCSIPVSCFTATAKQKVISDICDYFKEKLGVELEIFASAAERENLRYTVLYKETDEEKYQTLRELIASRDCPVIVYVSRTRRTQIIAERLTSDGFTALPYNGKMDAAEKVANQDAFINNEVQVMVATSAFGMGVDKKDVGLVVHYDISDSLESYVQEAGRAGRDPGMQAECFVLYNDNDLDKHFILLNQTKLSISEIQQIWSAIKKLTQKKSYICSSPLEIARAAGWDDSVSDIETRVKTAVSALETAGFIKRGHNVPHIYATSILAKSMAEASELIDRSSVMSDIQKKDSKRIIKFLISSRSTSQVGTDDAEARVDYIADNLGLTTGEVINYINTLRQENILADNYDMTAYIYSTDTENKAMRLLDRFAELESFLLRYLADDGASYDIRLINEAAENENIKAANVKNIRTLLYYLTIKGYVRKVESQSQRGYRLLLAIPLDRTEPKQRMRIDIARFVLKRLYELAEKTQNASELGVQFSLVGLYNEYMDMPKFEIYTHSATLADMEDALLYLSKIGAIRLEGGFLVLYSGMELRRIVTDNKARYKAYDYHFLNEFYKQRIKQIHIVGEYANLMVRDYNAALQFVHDYFHMDFKEFIGRYFQGDRASEIDRNITPEKYNQLFGELSDIQSRIITDADSKYIVVAAGPGSGKTRVLVHKLASLLLMEDVKHEQLLMLTFSRAAATEFKKRLYALIGNAAKFVDVKTFHSYCFDLLGKIGSLDGSEQVVERAVELIEDDEVEPGRITKSVLVIDEAQDMDKNEFALVQALMRHNPDMRVIAVGDDDQSIYEFRGASPDFMRSFAEELGAVKYEMTENFRSAHSIVELANAFSATISSRMKTRPIEAVTDEAGIVHITRHSLRHMAQAVAEHIRRVSPKGSVCVLTSTNEEVQEAAWLLKKYGIKPCIIQSADGFRLSNLAEIRYLLRIIDSELMSPVISDSIWEKARRKLQENYADSTCLENCLNMMRDFDEVSPVRYRSDFEQFIRESRYEDFYNQDTDTVYVSTVHKSKGREFDTVFMMLSTPPAASDEERRKLYVGMTRAKTALYIHCCTDIFASLSLKLAQKTDDFTEYPEPDVIELELSYRDVVLDFFRDKKGTVLSLRSGDELSVYGAYLQAEINRYNVSVVKLSKTAQTLLADYAQRGYVPDSASVRFIVAWLGEGDTDETAVILPNIILKKEKR